MKLYIVILLIAVVLFEVSNGRPHAEEENGAGSELSDQRPHERVKRGNAQSTLKLSKVNGRPNILLRAQADLLRTQRTRLIAQGSVDHTFSLNPQHRKTTCNFGLTMQHGCNNHLDDKPNNE